jgi:hypothetical protein
MAYYLKVVATQESTYLVELGFMPASQAIADPDHPGLFRAGTRAAAPYGDNRVEVHACAATDWTNDNSQRPDLFEFGFDLVDLSGFEILQNACEQVRVAGRVNDHEAAKIREALEGAVLESSGGKTLKVLFIAEEGFIMRSAGPNRMSVVGPESTGMNDHGGATSVHADQDVFGTPLTQLMDGRAPTLFRHDSPDGYNHDESTMLVNMWIPLQQITQPLVLADGRSIDRRKHQLRYGLATDSFLDRDDDLAVNDIWTFMYDPDQQWYFRSEMDYRSAYVFDTLSTPHGAAVLPGEETAEQCYLALQAAESAASTGQLAELTAVLSDAWSIELPEQTTPALGKAITAMLNVLNEARNDPAAVCGEQSEQWVASSRLARQSVVRMSIELRLVVSVTS